MLDNVKRVRFSSITVPANKQGIPLGQGKCCGVRLRPNAFVVNSSTLQDSGNAVVTLYVGDAKQQTWEYLIKTKPNGSDFWNTFNNLNSEWIPCTDLSQIYVRVYVNSGGGGAITNITVQMMIAENED